MSGFASLSTDTPPRGHLARGTNRPPAAMAVPAAVGLGGWVKRPQRLDAARLDALGAIDITDFVVICTLDGPHGAARPMRGTRLRPLIELAEPAFVERTDFKRVVVVAQGRDGYRALFSWAELFNSAVGDGVYVVFDGIDESLDANTGPFALISRMDHATGPRFVRGLATIELHKLW